jgi:thiosulfate reductase cytochrome b subunit
MAPAGLNDTQQAGAWLLAAVLLWFLITLVVITRPTRRRNRAIRRARRLRRGQGTNRATAQREYRNV